DNLSVQGDVSGTITVKRDGVDLGKIEKGTYQDYTKCLLAMTDLLLHPVTTSSPQASTQFDEDAALERATENLVEWQRWSYWKDRGLWNNTRDYCYQLRSFLASALTASFQYDAGGPVKLANVRDDKIKGNFIVRSDPNWPGRYCSVGKDAYKLVA